MFAPVIAWTIRRTRVRRISRNKRNHRRDSKDADDACAARAMLITNASMGRAERMSVLNQPCR
eukprot:6980684-Prymnesium_polylepis.1